MTWKEFIIKHFPKEGPKLVKDFPDNDTDLYELLS